MILKKMKLFPKTFCYMLFLLGIVILITHLSLYFFLPHFYMRSMRKDLDEKIEVLSDTLKQVDTDSMDDILESYAKRNNVNIAVKVEGLVRYYEGFSIQIDIDADVGQELKIGGLEEAESILIKRKDLVDKNGKNFSLQMTLNTRPVKEAKSVTLSLLPLTIGISVCISLAFSYFFSRKVTKPVLQMVEKTRDMQQLKEDAFFEIQGHDEIGILAEQINHVYKQLWETIHVLEKDNQYIAQLEREKVNFLRSTSHELKTPLTTLRIMLENMQYNVGKYKDHEKYLSVSVETVDRVSEMLRGILEASGIRECLNKQEKTMLLAKKEIVAVYADYEILAKTRNLCIEMQIEEDMQVYMNGEAFNKIWSNLISNAIKYSTMGGSVLITGQGTELSIKNTCELIPDEQLNHIFDAFYRPESSKSQHTGGNGLGLYIVKEMLEAVQAEYEFKPYEEGMCFTIRFKEM